MAQHAGRGAHAEPDADPRRRRRDARLRVGRRRRQRLPAARPVRPVLDDGHRRREVHRLRQHHRDGHRDAQPDAVPRAQRRAGVRRGHRAVGVGPGQHQRLGLEHDRSQRQPGRPQHAAGDREPVRRHGRAAVRAAARPGGRKPVRPITPPRRRRSPRRPPAPTSATARQATISGTATDTGGGVVAGVEVSTDGGATWHPATGTTSAGPTPGPRTAARRRRSRPARSTTAATWRRPAPGRTVNVACDVLAAGARAPRPSIVDAGDGNAVEVGVKFKTDTFGVVTGVRFYKAAAEHRHAHRQPVDRRRPAPRARSTFTGETASGWQTARFSTPVAITPGTTYVASYYAPNGHYSVSDPGFFYSPAPFGAQPARQSAAARRGRSRDDDERAVRLRRLGASRPAATRRRTTTSTSPSRRHPPPGQATAVTATGGPGSATVSWTAPTTGGPPTSYIVTPYLGSIPQLPTSVSGTPLPTSARVSGLTPGQTYTFRVTASNPAGDGPASDAVQRGDADPRDRAQRAARRRGGRDVAYRAGQVDGAGDRRRPADHRLHGDALRRAPPRGPRSWPTARRPR